MLVPAFGIGLTFAVSTVSAAPQSPAPLWRNVSRIVLVCSTSFDATLCEAIQKVARTRSVLPIVALTGNAPTDRGTVIVTIDPDDDGRRLVAVARRALEIDDAEGPARYAVAWDAAAPMTAVEDLLTRILPHRSGGGQWLE
jgi:hypothetical protein